MDTTTAGTPASTPVADKKPAPVVIPDLNPDAVFAALANPTRVTMLMMLAEGQALAAAQFTTRLGGNFDTLSKHLRIMRDSGIVASRPGENDNRLACYFIPDRYRTTPGQIDYGCCVLRTPFFQSRGG